MSHMELFVVWIYLFYVMFELDSGSIIPSVCLSKKISIPGSLSPSWKGGWVISLDPLAFLLAMDYQGIWQSKHNKGLVQ
jgi:hypothetical protein